MDFNPESPSTHEGGYLDGGVGWYRKTFTVPSSLGNKQVSLDFDGVDRFAKNATSKIEGR